MSEAGLELTEQVWFFLLEDIWQPKVCAEKIAQRCSQTFWRTSCLKIIWLELVYNDPIFQLFQKFLSKLFFGQHIVYLLL